MCTHRELHHSYFIYYWHGTPENCVIHTNPSANAFKWYMAWLANNEIKVTWNTKAMCTIKWWWGQEAGRNVCMSVCWGDLTVTVSRPPNPSSERRKQTELRREEERFYSWLLLWVPCQNKPLWCVCVLFSQQSTAVTQQWLQLKQGQEETNKGNEIWKWNHEKQFLTLPSPPRYPSGKVSESFLNPTKLFQNINQHYLKTISVQMCRIGYSVYDGLVNR